MVVKIVVPNERNREIRGWMEGEVFCVEDSDIDVVEGGRHNGSCDPR